MLKVLIKKYEGCSLQAYKCFAGVWTIGYGTTVYPDGTPVKSGDIITQTYADVLLEDYIDRHIRPLFTKFPYALTELQQCAVASLVYNIGVSAFLHSKLYKAICDKDYAEVCRQWDWYKADGKVLLGLVKRRAEELYTFVNEL